MRGKLYYEKPSEVVLTLTWKEAHALYEIASRLPTGGQGVHVVLPEDTRVFAWELYASLGALTGEQTDVVETGAHKK